MVPRQSTISGSRSGLSVMTGGLPDQYSANSAQLSPSRPAASLRTGRLSPLSEEARELRAQRTLRYLRATPIRLRLLYALLLPFQRLAVRMEASHQKRFFASQSPSSNHSSFWAQKAVFLWHLVAKSAKICWAVTSGDMSGLYIGAGSWCNQNRDACPEGCLQIGRAS